MTPAAISHQIARARSRSQRSAVSPGSTARSTDPLGQGFCSPGLSEAFAGIHAAPCGGLRAHNDTGTLTVTASPSLRRQIAGAAAAPVSGASTRSRRAPFLPAEPGRPRPPAFRHGPSATAPDGYPGLVVEELMQNEVFPACSPDCWNSGPPLRTPEDLRHAPADRRSRPKTATP